MDFFVRHLAAFPRRFPSPCPVHDVGDLKGKDHWMRRKFPTCNFSFILSGEGEYHRRKKVWPVVAPCVITQWPGEFLSYGPPLPSGRWDEFYLVYAARCTPWFRQRRYIEDNRPVWPIHNQEGVMALVDEARALLNHRNPEMHVDRVDRICERMILESLLPGSRSGPEPGDDIVQRIVIQFRQRPEVPHDFDQLAREHGLSASTLRRRWCEALKITPGRYLLNLRIQKARRLLVETALQVGEIAAKAGFQDMLYFSRRFKLETAMTPSQYRQSFGLSRRKSSRSGTKSSE